MTATETARAWMAGFIDGEGWLTAECWVSRRCRGMLGVPQVPPYLRRKRLNANSC